MPRVSTKETAAGEIADRKPICVDRETTILAASSLMRLYEVDELLVVEPPRQIVGIVTARDIVTRIIATGLDPAVLTAGDIAWTGSAGAQRMDSVSL